MSEAKKHTGDYVAAFDWRKRVINHDPRVDIGWAIIEANQRALNGCKLTQVTRIASLAIRNPNPHLSLYIGLISFQFVCSFLAKLCCQFVFRLDDCNS